MSDGRDFAFLCTDDLWSSLLHLACAARQKRQVFIVLSLSKSLAMITYHYYIIIYPVSVSNIINVSFTKALVCFHLYLLNIF